MDTVIGSCETQYIKTQIIETKRECLIMRFGSEGKPDVIANVETSIAVKVHL